MSAQPALTEEQTLYMRWLTTKDVGQRDQLIEELKQKNLFPGGYFATKIQELEEEAGLYPDTGYYSDGKDADPLFLTKVLKKREFAETKQKSMAELLAEGTNLCDKTRTFELSPVQRFISRFLSPATPYNSALLFHGVGVGKTCAAVNAAEAFLEKYPKKPVIIIAPPNIQPNFLKEIFSYTEDKLKIGRGEEVNEQLGCTGNTYIQMAGVEYVRDVNVIRNRVSRLVSKRYDIYGYIEFYNYIVNKVYSRVPKGLSDTDRATMQSDLLRREFSGRFIIIDEAHNLRDIGEGAEDTADTETNELSDAEAGKKLTPVLKNLLDKAEGTKLMLLTATPMYNSVREIIFLFNLLLLNDKKMPLSESAPGSATSLFTAEGDLTELGKQRIGLVARSYLSYMKGENPLSFPVRLEPLEVPRTTFWPSRAPNGAPISPQEVERMRFNPEDTKVPRMPFIEVQFPPETLSIYREISEFGLQEGGMAVASVDLLVQAGNFIFPTTGPILYGLGKAKGKGDGDGEKKTRRPKIMSHIREYGFNDNFKLSSADEQTVKTISSKKGPPTWLLEANIGKYSPKTAFLLNQIRRSKGVNFVYSRFIASGALSIALALEANGYVNATRDVGILRDGIQDALGGQCALCESREKQHSGKDHAFKQAKYVLLTGRAEFSGNNDKAVKKASAPSNVMGEEVKVVIGSQVASEGIDLAFVRNIFVFDSWFHLNKLEQILGRGIRMCSHALLDPLLRNVTIHLMVNAYPQSYNLETMDLYMYRFALDKAIIMGKVSRFLKMNALDCNLNKTAIQVKGLPPRDQVDAMGRLRKQVNVNDVPFTSLCDWLEEPCDYECAKPVTIHEDDAEESTYDEYSARFRESKLKKRLAAYFTKQPFATFRELEILFSDIPLLSLLSLLSDVVDNRNFRVTNGAHHGYITFRNGFYLFQPDGIMDSRAPLAIRVGDYPVKVDEYDPQVLKLEKTAVEMPSQQEETIDKDELIKFWRACVAWTIVLKEPESNPAVPDILTSVLKTRYKKNKNELRKVTEALSMVPWLFESLKFNKNFLVHFVSVFLQFIWDEFLSYKEQLLLFTELYPGGMESMREIWEENVITVDRESVMRILNPKTGQLEYYMNGALLKSAQVKFWESPDHDRLNGLSVNTQNTAPIYGTNNYKYGNIVFKLNKPKVATTTEPNPKPDSGSECSIVSTTGFHLKSLYELGGMAKSTMGRDLGLEEKVLRGTRAFKVNVINLCTLKNLTLRMLDSLRAGEKRWFYRPISTLLSGHRGILRK